MYRKKLTRSTPTLQWKCMESKELDKRLSYGRFVIMPLREGQADTIGLSMRRALLAEIEGTCIRRVKFDKIAHEFSTITGIEESLGQILMNLKAIVLRSDFYGTHTASICVKGPGYITAEHISLPPAIEIVDNTQPIANLTEAIDFFIELEIESNPGSLRNLTNNFQVQDGSYSIDAQLRPVVNVNHSVHFVYENKNKKHEMLFLEIWTNGSLTPKEALYEASRKLIDLFIPFLGAEEENLLGAEEENLDLEKNENVRIKDGAFLLKSTMEFIPRDRLEFARRKFKSIFIDQLELTPKIYNCLKNANIETLWDLFELKAQDFVNFINMERLDIQDIKQLLDIMVAEYFTLPEDDIDDQYRNDENPFDNEPLWGGWDWDDDE